jgi:hypothetical protein
MTAEEYYHNKVSEALSGATNSPNWLKVDIRHGSGRVDLDDVYGFAEAYHKAELERLVEEVDGVMVDITKGMYFDMVSAAAFRGSLLKIAGIE